MLRSNRSSAAFRPGATRSAVLVLSNRFWKRRSAATDCGRPAPDERPILYRGRVRRPCPLSRRQRRLHARLGLPVPQQPGVARGPRLARVLAFSKLRKGELSGDAEANGLVARSAAVR
jgi:hypothetical protein